MLDIRAVSAMSETTTHRVDERPWECTIRLLSGNKVPPGFLQIWFTYGLGFAYLRETKAALSK